MGGANIVVCVLLGILGFVAAGLGFAAEATRIKVSDIIVTRFGCDYPSSPANILGYIAALLLLGVLIITSSITRCACCNRNTANNTQSAGAIFFFIISCIASIIGIGILVAAGNLSTRQEYLSSTGLCYYVKPGVFASGGGLALVACIFGLCSYSSSTKQRREQVPAAVPYQGGGVAMGTPQFDTASTNSNPKPRPVQYAV
ncbi:uncharacterized protein LOC110736063 [Chenopodium quinoa]|uniref:Uncharacterized protein n=1 Tax=Chenopodium quinoa TaxID=63459 RepID=A0A803KPC6_CHEQI|nr:uncharacterized protein LOC110736063 [Chenopodium quinoa]